MWVFLIKAHSWLRCAGSCRGFASLIPIMILHHCCLQWLCCLVGFALYEDFIWHFIHALIVCIEYACTLSCIANSVHLYGFMVVLWFCWPYLAWWCIGSCQLNPQFHFGIVWLVLDTRVRVDIYCPTIVWIRSPEFNLGN